MKKIKTAIAVLLTLVCIINVYGCEKETDTSIPESEANSLILVSADNSSASEVEQSLKTDFNTLYGQYEANTKITKSGIEELFANSKVDFVESVQEILSDGTTVNTLLGIDQVSRGALWLAFFDTPEDASKHFCEMFRFSANCRRAARLYTMFDSAVRIGNVIAIGTYNIISFLLENYNNEFVPTENKYLEPNTVVKHEGNININNILSYMTISGYSEYSCITDLDVNVIFWGFVNFDINDFCFIIKMKDSDTAENYAKSLKENTYNHTLGICYMYSDEYVLASRTGVWEKILSEINVVENQMSEAMYN